MSPQTDAASSSVSSVPVKKIDRKSNIWMFYKDAWEMLSMLYEGGVRLRENVDKFIIRRSKELYDVFYERARRLTYQDILQCCISWHLSKMFQREPVITDKDKSTDLTDFLQNCDRKGTTFVKFSSELLETMMLYRTAFVLIDKPVPGTIPIITRQDERSAGLHMPYLTIFDPRSVINWNVGKDGKLDWIIFKTTTADQPDPFGPIEVKVNWWLFDRQRYHHYIYSVPKVDEGNVNQYFNSQREITGSAEDSKATLVDEGLHTMSELREVPVRVCELPMHLWHANRAYLHLLEHVDTMNAYSWKLFMANIPQLTVFSDEEVTAPVLAESGYLKFGKDDKVEWLEPKSSTFSESRIHLSNTRQEIYRSFHLVAQGKDQSATADGSSGYSKEVEMAPAVDVLNALGDELRGNMQNILHYVKKVGGMGEEIPDVNGFQFETHPVMANISKFQAASDSGIIQKSETLERTVAEDIAMDLVDGKNETLKMKIRAEIQASKSISEMMPPPDPTKQGPGLNVPEFQTRDSRAQAANILRAEGTSS